jgi:hypothetical protein
VLPLLSVSPLREVEAGACLTGYALALEAASGQGKARVHYLTSHDQTCPPPRKVRESHGSS